MIIAEYYIRNFLVDKFDDDVDEYIDFLVFFSQYIPHHQHIYDDSSCASMILEILNNRGIKLNSVDIMRNSLLRALPEKDREKYFMQFQELITGITKYGSLLKNTEMAYLETIYYMFKEKISCTDNILEKYTELINSDHVDKSFKKIVSNTKIFDDLHEYMNNNVCKWGNIYLLDNIWQMYQYVIIPFFKMFQKHKDFKKIFDKILEIIICFQIKSSTGVRNFRSSEKHLILFGNLIYNKTYDITEICEELVHIINKFFFADSDKYQISKFIKKPLLNTKAKFLLLYYELKNTPDGHNFDIANIDVEHIMPKVVMVKI